MKKYYKGLIITLIFALAFVISPVYASYTLDYDNVSLNDWNNGNTSDIWDLTACDLTLSYTIDLSDQATGGWTPVEVGLREVGAPNIDPNYQGGFMWHNWQNPATNPNLADLDDHLLLGDHGWALDEQQYNVDESGNIVTPFGTYNSYAFWFDRDGVDEWQDDMWQYTDGVTYNTGGVYDVEIAYHAVDANIGTMMATINGEAQGFNGFPPDRQPVGRSFAADMENLQLFYGRGGGGGAIVISNIEIVGCVNDMTAPLVTIEAPEAGDLVSGVVDIYGSIVEDYDLSHYNIAIYAGDADYMDFSQRLEQQTVYLSAGFDNQNIYQWDTTGYTDGEYLIRLAARDAAGNRDISGDAWAGGDDSQHVIKVIVNNTADNIDECKKGGWEMFTDTVFKNQGDCVSWVQSNLNAYGNRKDN